MKKFKYLILITVLSFGLTGCFLQKDETKTVATPEETTEALSDDNSLETIKSELDKTVIDEFEADFEAIDQDINQL